MAFTSFLILLIWELWGIVRGDYAVSVVPGWHTPIIAPWAMFSITLTLFTTFILIFYIITYWRLIGRFEYSEIKIFIIHFLLSTPFVIFNNLNVQTMAIFFLLFLAGFILFSYKYFQLKTR